MSGSNRVTLAQLSKMGTAEAETLPVDQIAMLLEDIADREKCIKAAKDKLHAVCVQRYGARAQVARKSDGKDTGTVNLVDGEYAIKADLPKKPEWDQAKLAALAETIRTVWKRDPAEYIKATYTVEERKYSAWPSDLQQQFIGARTLKAGKPTFEFTPRKAEAA